MNRDPNWDTSPSKKPFWQRFWSELAGVPVRQPTGQRLIVLVGSGIALNVFFWTGLAVSLRSMNFFVAVPFMMVAAACLVVCQLALKPLRIIPTDEDRKWAQ